ncbi:hypothetical protein [Paenibacillus sp. 1P03SA]|uniref:hypothetical protein n=1 Tax=Paenibacillus sp. 1P03SA TaxID=3132294 RepID=UPI0039A37AF6
MIKYEGTKKWCNSCLNEEGNFLISVGLDENQTSSISLCHDCRVDLMSKLAGNEQMKEGTCQNVSIFDKAELAQMQIATYHHVQHLENDLKKLKPSDIGYDRTLNDLAQARAAKEKIMAL